MCNTLLIIILITCDMALPAFDAMKKIALQRLSLFDYIVSLPLIYCNLCTMLRRITNPAYKLNCFLR